jgi:WD40 repeat protein
MACLATGLRDGTVRLWDPDTGTPQLVLGGESPSGGGVVFSPDGSNLASVHADGLVRVWALDLDDLIAIASAPLTRTLTDDECRLHLERRPATLNRRSPAEVPSATDLPQDRRRSATALSHARGVTPPLLLRLNLKGGPRPV